MKEQSSNGVQVPGTQDATQAARETVDVQTVTEYLKKDLSVAISCLNALYSDPDLLSHMAHFMHGRFINSKAKEELK